MSANNQAEAQRSAKTNVQLSDDDPTSDVDSSDELMSGSVAASGDVVSGFATPGDADCFHTAPGRTARKKHKAKPTPGGVITVLPPIQERTCLVGLETISSLHRPQLVSAV